MVMRRKAWNTSVRTAVESLPPLYPTTHGCGSLSYAFAIRQIAAWILALESGCVGRPVYMPLLVAPVLSSVFRNADTPAGRRPGRPIPDACRLPGSACNGKGVPRCDCFLPRMSSYV